MRENLVQFNMLYQSGIVCVCVCLRCVVVWCGNYIPKIPIQITKAGSKALSTDWYALTHFVLEITKNCLGGVLNTKLVSLDKYHQFLVQKRPLPTGVYTLSIFVLDMTNKYLAGEFTSKLDSKKGFTKYSGVGGVPSFRFTGSQMFNHLP